MYKEAREELRVRFKLTVLEMAARFGVKKTYIFSVLRTV
jgi:hypothetical protein